MFELKASNFDTLVRNNIHYLLADSNMFGECKFGDFAMYSTYLYYLKRYIITYWPEKFNRDNLFFIFNKQDNVKLDDLQLLLSLFSNVWKGYDTIEGGKCNIRQLVTAGNLWSFKTYLDNKNIYLTDKDIPIITPFNLSIPYNKRDSIFIYPVRNKLYNVERNMGLTDIVNIINSVSNRDKIYIITKDNNIDFEVLRSCSNRNLTELNDDITWTDILIEIMVRCKLYISGDCGLSHFVSLIDHKYKPDMTIYYNTKPLVMQERINEFDRAVDEINFIPYKTYKESKLTIINNLTGK